MQEVNFEKVDFLKVLKVYNIRNLKKRGNEVSFSCPFPEHLQGDRHPSASINYKTGAFLCWGCKRSGNLVTLVAELENISIPRAAKKLSKGSASYYKEDTLPKPLNYREIIEKRFFPNKEKILPEVLLENFYVEWGDKSYRDISGHTLQKYDVGFDEKTDRLTLPYRNKEGDLVGFKGRTIHIKEEPRYLALGDKTGNFYGFPTFRAVDYLFGTQNLDESTPIIVEGEFDVMSLHDRGFNACSINGSNPTAKQIRLLKDFDKIILLLDPDDAGRKAQRAIIKKMKGSHPDSIVATLIDNDPAESSVEDINKAISQGKTFLEM